MESSGAPGKSFLKISGILMIILSIFAIVVMLLTLLGVGLLGGAIGVNYGTTGVALVGIAIFAFIIGIISSAFLLICGWFGVKFCDDPSKANTLFVFGIILVVFQVISMVSSFNLNNLLGLALVGAYLYGAYLNKQVA